MAESLKENDKVFVLGGRNKWGTLRNIYSNCVEPSVKIYIIDIDGDQTAYKREQFLSRSNLVLALESIGHKVI